MNATDNLRNDRILIRRLKDIVQRCSDKLYTGEEIPIEDIEIILVVIEKFVDRFHHGKEEAYFPNTETKDSFSKSNREFLIEHELGRRIAMMLRRDLSKYKNKDIKTIEPVARFLKSYSVFIDDHTRKEDKFFDLIETMNSISDREDYELLHHYQICANNIGGIERLKQVVKLIEYL